MSKRTAPMPDGQARCPVCDRDKPLVLGHFIQHSDTITGVCPTGGLTVAEAHKLVKEGGDSHANGQRRSPGTFATSGGPAEPEPANELVCSGCGGRGIILAPSRILKGETYQLCPQCHPSELPSEEPPKPAEPEPAGEYLRVDPQPSPPSSITTVASTGPAAKPKRRSAQYWVIAGGVVEGPLDRGQAADALSQCGGAQQVLVLKGHAVQVITQLRLGGRT